MMLKSAKFHLCEGNRVDKLVVLFITICCLFKGSATLVMFSRVQYHFLLQLLNVISAVLSQKQWWPHGDNMEDHKRVEAQVASWVYHTKADAQRLPKLGRRSNFMPQMTLNRIVAIKGNDGTTENNEKRSSTFVIY